MNKQENNITTEEVKKLVDETVLKFMKLPGFTSHKITDTPTDTLSIVNRRFVTLNGSVVSRVSSSVATVGRFYLDTESNIPMWKVSAGWVNGVGSIVAQNN